MSDFIDPSLVRVELSFYGLRESVQLELSDLVIRDGGLYGEIAQWRNPDQVDAEVYDLKVSLRPFDAVSVLREIPCRHVIPPGGTLGFDFNNHPILTLDQDARMAPFVIEAADEWVAVDEDYREVVL